MLRRYMSFESRLATLKGGSVDLAIDRQVARLTLSHVAKHNSLSGVMMLGLREAVIELEQMASKTNDLKAVVFTGAGDKAFCAGSDLGCLSEFTSPDEGAQFCRFMQETTQRLDQLPVPVITRINGVAYGGGSELSTIGDMRSASPNARVAFVHKKMALQPGWGGAARLIKLVGRQCAVELLLTARVLSPDELIRLNLVANVLTTDAFEQWVEENLINMHASVLRGIKANVLNAAQMPTRAEYNDEENTFKQLYGADENREAVLAVINSLKK